MLSLNVALGVALFGQGAAQLLPNVPMTVGERIGGMASFAVVTVVAAVLLGRILRRLPRHAWDGPVVGVGRERHPRRRPA